LSDLKTDWTLLRESLEVSAIPSFEGVQKELVDDFRLFLLRKMTAAFDRSDGEILGHLAPDRLHIEQASDGAEILSPDGKDRTGDFDLGIDKILRDVLSAGPVVRQRSPDASLGGIRLHVCCDCFIRNALRIVAPIRKEMTKPDLFPAGEQSFGQIGHLVKQKEPILAGDPRIHLAHDDARRHVVHHDESVDQLGIVFHQPRSNPGTSIMSDQCESADAKGLRQLDNIIGHGPLVVAGRWLVGIAIAAQVGRYYAISTRKLGNLESPSVARLRKAMKQDDGRAAVWSVVTFVMEALVFVLVGLALRGVLHRFGSDWGTVGALVPAAATIFAVLVLARFAWIFPTAYIPRALVPSLRARDPYPPFAVPLVMSWAGMRGVVSLAAALSLPEQFPGRDIILFVTFCVVAATIVALGLTLGPVAKTLAGKEFLLRGQETLSEEAVRAEVVRAQFDAIRTHSVGAEGKQAHPRLVEQYGHRLAVAEDHALAKGSHEEQRLQHYRAVLIAVVAGRKKLLELFNSGRIHDSVMHRLESELDQEELFANRVVESN
jgi:hypothetical protein